MVGLDLVGICRGGAVAVCNGLKGGVGGVLTRTSERENVCVGWSYHA